ncbi:MAG: Nif3-like dinuclear metal center hexameric protein [Thalassotalea sp.]
MQLSSLENYLAELLSPQLIKDFCPNGLQVQGKNEIKKIVTGVTASQALIDAAIAEGADALLVHHGYFWKNEAPVITGMKYHRIKALLDHNISLLAYHLPLDVHPELGNNAQLAKLLGIKVTGLVEENNPFSVVVKGELSKALSADAFNQLLSNKLQRQSLHLSSASNGLIKTVAWCTGGGQGYIDLAAAQGIDAFISGEASEQTTHSARELDIHFFAAGHHATERYGVKALGEHLAEQFALEVKFIDIDNPV